MWLLQEIILSPFIIILSSNQNPKLKRITANACVFWSNIVSANKPSITPPNAIRSGGNNELITVNLPGNTKTPKS